MSNVKKSYLQYIFVLHLFSTALEKPWFLLKSTEHNFIYRILYAFFCLSASHSIDIYRILLVFLELNDFFSRRTR